MAGFISLKGRKGEGERRENVETFGASAYVDLNRKAALLVLLSVHNKNKQACRQKDFSISPEKCAENGSTEKIINAL